MTNFPIHLSRWILIVGGLFSISPWVEANLSDDVIGSYVGNLTERESGGSLPGQCDFVGTSSLTLTIEKKGSNKFKGDGVFSFSDGETDALAVDISGLTESTFQFTYTQSGIGNSFSGSGTGTGSLVASGVFINASGTEGGGFGCNFTFSGTLSKTSSTNLVVDPAITTANSVLDVVLFNTQTQATISDIASHITGALSGIGVSSRPKLTDNSFKMEATTGVGAGDDFAYPYGVWGAYSYIDFENTLSSLAFDGNSHGFLGGLDVSFWENTVLGIAVGYERSDTDTDFNRGNPTTDTYTVAPYFGVMLSDIFSVDFSIGYSYVDMDQFRRLPTGSARITSSPSSDRWFTAFNVNGVVYHENWVFSG